MQFLFLSNKIIVGLKIQMTDRTFMPSSINGQNILKKSENLDFYATLGENNEGCQELPFSATRNKKMHHSALQWHYSSSTVVLFSSIVPWFFCPQFPLSISNLNNFGFVRLFSKFFFSLRSYHLGPSTMKISENHDLNWHQHKLLKIMKSLQGTFCI